MNVIATETETPTTSAPQQYPASSPALLLPTLDLAFAEGGYAQPRIARGICCSAKDVWYSNNHWPEDDQCAWLFPRAHETARILDPGLREIWDSGSIRVFFQKIDLATTPLTVELRMAGRRHEGDEQIKLRPSVWIRTADEVIKAKAPWKELKRLVERLRLDSPQYASIYAEGGAIFADDSVSIAKDNLTLDKGITFAGGEALYTHILAKPPGGSACGLLCLTTIIKDNTVLEQNLSRIGGLISYKSSRQGVTSGHVILQHFLRSSSGASLSVRSGQKDDRDDLESLQSGSDSDEEIDDDLELVQNHQRWTVDQNAAQVLGYVDLADLTQWVSVTPSDTINFVAQAEKGLTQNSTWRVNSARPIPADFALISGIADWEHDNYYLDPSPPEFPHGLSRGEKKWVSSYDDDNSLKARDVLILVDQESDHIFASLQPASIPLIIGRATFYTRKIRLTAPLGRGTSGSWVVDRISGALCGSIIMVFNREPYALMITAETLLSDIHNYTSMTTEHSIPPAIAQPLSQNISAKATSEAQESHITSPEEMIKQTHSKVADKGDNSDYSSATGIRSTASLTSSNFEYKVINGRTYKDTDGRYWAPNDEKACEALDILHSTSMLILDDKLHLAPLEESQIRHVLDIGTGTGTWAMDFADEFPEAEVIGIDISPIQPNWIPPNLEFQIDDFTQEWTFPLGMTDFIHMRFLGGSVPDWHDLYKKAFRTIKPGGCIETHEYNPEFFNDDGLIEDGSALAEWARVFQSGSEKLGQSFIPIPSDLQKDGLEAAGFVDIHSLTIKVPVGNWPKEKGLKKIGLFAKYSVSFDVQGQIGFMAHLSGWTNEEITDFCRRFRDELESTAHVYYYHQIAWGRKPK